MPVSEKEGSLSNYILLFDGLCNLCNRSVNLVLKNDRKKVIKFASLQSPAGNELIQKHDLQGLDNQTLILIEGANAYHHSTAVLKVIRILGGGWRLLYAFIIIPKPIRDYIYTIIARNRARWFGLRASCRMPAPEELDRFIQ